VLRDEWFSRYRQNENREAKPKLGTKKNIKVEINGIIAGLVQHRLFRRIGSKENVMTKERKTHFWLR